MSEVLAALSLALDLGEERPVGHALRTCLIGLEIGTLIGLPLQDLRDLYYAALLKDAGCTTPSAARLRLPTRLTPAAAADLASLRANRGAEVVHGLGVGAGVTDAVRSLGERWDGGGHPRQLRGSAIPVVARTLLLAETLDAYAATQGPSLALDVARARRGKWFDPTLSDAARDLGPRIERLVALEPSALQAEVLGLEPGGASVIAGPAALDRITLGFAEIVDTKSPFTAGHSRRVADLALAIARRTGIAPDRHEEIRHAALLHDLGKLATPSVILDKPGPLDTSEERVLRCHVRITREIVSGARGLSRIAEVAGTHHERLDGSGYDRGLAGEAISLEARAISVADVFDALVSARPYRPALPEDVALRIMERERGALDPDHLDALEAIVHGVAAGDADEDRRAA